MRIVAIVFGLPLVVLFASTLMWIASVIFLGPILVPAILAGEPSLKLPFVYGFIAYNGAAALGFGLMHVMRYHIDEMLVSGLLQMAIGWVIYLAIHGMPIV